MVDSLGEGNIWWELVGSILVLKVFLVLRGLGSKGITW